MQIREATGNLHSHIFIFRGVTSLGQDNLYYSPSIESATSDRHLLHQQLQDLSPPIKSVTERSSSAPPAALGPLPPPPTIADLVSAVHVLTCSVGEPLIIPSPTPFAHQMMEDVSTSFTAPSIFVSGNIQEEDEIQLLMSTPTCANQ